MVAKPLRVLLLALAAVSLAAAAPRAVADPVSLTLTTENYPPFNMQEEASGRIVGISTDIVRALMARAGQNYRIAFLPWQRAFNDALTHPSTCVFSTTETPERLPKFQWVGPLVTNNWIFFGREDTNIEITSLADAKQFTVGGYKGDAVALYLESEGFNQDLAAFDHLNPKKLAARRFPLWATGQYLGPYLAAQAGVSIKPLFTFRETVMSMACNQSIDRRLIQRLNTTLQALKDDGTVGAIVERYRH